MRKLLAALSLLLLLTACSQSGPQFEAKSMDVTDPTITPQNPMTIQPKKSGSSPVVLGFLQTENMHIVNNDGELTLDGHINVVDASGALLHSRNIELTGAINEQKQAVLKPKDTDEPLFPARARVTCLSDSRGSSCDRAIIDLYVKQDGKILATQLTAELYEKNAPSGLHQKPDAKKQKTEKTESVAVTPLIEEPDLAEPAPAEPKKEEPATPPTPTPAPKPSIHPPNPTPNLDSKIEDEKKKQSEKKEEPKKEEPATPPTPAPAPKPAEPAKPVTPAPAPKPAPTPAPKPAEPKKEEPPKKVEPAKPAPPQNEEPDEDDDKEDHSANEGVDSEDRPSIYVGTLFDGADELFEDDKKTEPTAPTKPQEPTQPEPKPVEPAKPQEPAQPTQPATPARPVDQAIGFANGGFLQNATDLKDKLSTKNFRLIHDGRDRHFGTFELVQIIDYLSKYSVTMPGSGVMRIADLSQKKGGVLKGTRHVSHQNGLDADIGYPSTTPDKNWGFPDMVVNRKLSSTFNAEETWALFKAAMGTKALDRIFVDKAIKKTLCEIAHAKGELEKHKELLRRIRPESGHDDHFHLRIRCSLQHPKCRMMGDPPAYPPMGTGCQAVGAAL